MTHTCGTYELIADLRGTIVSAGEDAAALCGATATTLLGAPLTRYLRGPAMTAPYGESAAVAIKRPHGEAPRKAVAVRALKPDAIHITLVPLPPAMIATAPQSGDGAQGVLAESVGTMRDALTGVLGFASLAHLAATPHRRRYHLEQVATQSDRARRVIQAAKNSTGPEHPYIAPADIAELVAQVVSQHRIALEAHGVSLELERAPGPLWAAVDARQLQDALSAFIERAAAPRRTPERRADLVEVRARALDHGVEIRLTFGGSEPTRLAQRLAPPERVAGRGLRHLDDVAFSVAHAQLSANGVQVAVAAVGDEDVAVTLVVGAAQAPTEPDQTRTPVPLEILTIDSDAMLGELYAELLAVSGHTVTPCRTLAAARQTLRSQRFDALVCAFELSDGGFAQLWAEMASTYPALDNRTVVVTNDQSAPRLLEWLAQRPQTPVLVKPFRIKALLTAISRLTA